MIFFDHLPLPTILTTVCRFKTRYTERRHTLSAGEHTPPAPLGQLSALSAHKLSCHLTRPAPLREIITFAPRKP